MGLPQNSASKRQPWLLSLLKLRMRLLFLIGYLGNVKLNLAPTVCPAPQNTGSPRVPLPHGGRSAGPLFYSAHLSCPAWHLSFQPPGGGGRKSS